MMIYVYHILIIDVGQQAFDARPSKRKEPCGACSDWSCISPEPGTSNRAVSILDMCMQSFLHCVNMRLESLSVKVHEGKISTSLVLCIKRKALRGNRILSYGSGVHVVNACALCPFSRSCSPPSFPTAQKSQRSLLAAMPMKLWSHTSSAVRRSPTGAR